LSSREGDGDWIGGAFTYVMLAVWTGHHT